MCLDQANAFERVHHVYLFRVLEKFGLGGGLVAYIKLLYHQIYSIFKVDNELIPPVKIEKGIPLGVPFIWYFKCLEY